MKRALVQSSALVLSSGLAFAVAPVDAASTSFGGDVQLRAGYTTNPFLEQGSGSGTGLVGVTLAPELTRETPLSKTTVDGRYDREQYFTRYGNSSTASAVLNHVQQLNENLSANGQIGYTSTQNALIGGVTDLQGIDQLSAGQRTRRLFGAAGLNWQADAQDSFSGSVNGTHVTYGGGFGLSNYNAYGVTGSYLRTLNARTQAGVSISVNRTEARAYGNTTTYQPNAQLVRQLNAIWKLNGSVGLVIQRSTGLINSSTTETGFNLSLCGTYPRTTICFTGSRQGSSNGYGGSRTDLRGGITVTHRMTELSTLTFNGYYDNSKPVGNSPIATQKLYAATLDYSRTLTQRLSATLGGRYQNRDYGQFGTARSFAGTAGVSYRFGRLR